MEASFRKRLTCGSRLSLGIAVELRPRLAATDSEIYPPLNVKKNWDPSLAWQTIEYESIETETDDNLAYLRRLVEATQSPFFYSLLRLEMQTMTWDVDSHQLDFVLKSEIKGVLNKPREQFNDKQEVDAAQEAKTYGRSRLVTERQIKAQLEEHALNRNLMSGEFLVDENGRLISPFQKTEGAFALLVLRKVFEDSAEYIRAKFNTELRDEDLRLIDKYFETLVPMIFSQEFMNTRVGLELAEYIGMRRLEELYKDKENQKYTIVVFSPYSDFRTTKKKYNVSNIFRMTTDRLGKKVEVTYARTEEGVNEYINRFNMTTGEHTGSAWEVVQYPIIFKILNVDGVLDRIGVESDPEKLALFDQAVEDEDCKREIEALVNMYLKEDPIIDIRAQREKVEKMVVAKHKELENNFMVAKLADLKKYVEEGRIEEAKEMQNYIDKSRQYFAWIASGYLMGGSCGGSFGHAIGGKTEDGIVVEAGRGTPCPCGVNFIGSHCPKCGMSKEECNKINMSKLFIGPIAIAA